MFLRPFSLSKRLNPEYYAFRAMRYLLKKYDANIYLKDEFGIIVQRAPTDNFEYLLRTGNACDAADMMRALQDKIRGSHVCLDVGANIGIVSVWMAQRADQVYAFEPASGNRQRMAENLRVNRADNVEVIPVAVADRAGQMTLHLHAGYGHHSLARVKTSPRIGQESVPVVTLNEFCAERRIEQVDVLKIDVEGYEVEVLQGASDLLRERRIRCVILEISADVLSHIGRSVDELLDCLTPFGYTFFDLQHQPLDRESLRKVRHLDVYAECHHAGTE